MNKYNRQQIDDLLQPIMTMMQEEFPNDCKLIVEPYFARIVFEHDYMVIPSDEMKKPFSETKLANTEDGFLKSILEVAMETAKEAAEEHHDSD